MALIDFPATSIYIESLLVDVANDGRQCRHIAQTHIRRGFEDTASSIHVAIDPSDNAARRKRRLRIGNLVNDVSKQWSCISKTIVCRSLELFGSRVNSDRCLTQRLENRCDVLGCVDHVSRARTGEVRTGEPCDIHWENRQQLGARQRSQPGVVRVSPLGRRYRKVFIALVHVGREFRSMGESQP